MTNAGTAIWFDDVVYTANGTPILKNITGTISEGKVTSLVGPSGAGKTTLFRLCNGLSSPDSGNVYILGQPIDSYEPAELRRKVGMALQNATMISGSVHKNLELPLKLQGDALPKDRAKEWLDLVGLNNMSLDKKTKDLSGGQQQKLSIARTLINQPDILLLDEITSSLDSVSRQAIEELIRRMNQENGITVLWITHDLSQAMEMGDDAWVMMNGELAEAGPSHLLENPQTGKVQQFVRGGTE